MSLSSGHPDLGTSIDEARGGGSGRHLLVVEDDAAIADAVARRLRSEGYRVAVAGDGPTAVEAAKRDRFDAVILDVMLPGLDGLEVCRRIQSHEAIPVLMLTARDEETDRIIGLAVGADDYMTKPFSVRELVARVAALLRRVDRAASLAASRERQESASAAVGQLHVDSAARRVSLDGEPIHLTPIEFDLLWALARRPGRVIPREELLVEVWGWDSAGAALAARSSAGRVMDSHVKALRRKVGGERIRTAHGVGFALEALS